MPAASEGAVVTAPSIGLHLSVQSGTDDGWEGLVRDTLDLVSRADRRGFSSAVFSEHHFTDGMSLPSPLQLATAAAMVTTRMRIGSNITLLALHHPVTIAEQAATLDLLSGGRALLGVGLGWMAREFDGLGVPFRARAAVFDRSLRQVRRLLAGEVVDSDERLHPFKGARIHPLRPGGAAVPIRVGATAERAVRRAARLGDAWVMGPKPTVSELQRLKRVFDAERADQGLPPVVEQPLRRDIFIADTEREAWERFAPGVRAAWGGFYATDQPDRPGLDSLDDVRRWSEDRLVVGTVESVTSELATIAARLDATEILVRWQLPGIDRAAAAACLHGLGEVVKRLGCAPPSSATGVHA
jgi:alkanesulfonate monooxygenase SsuD/methylene tetrahydromethanopterin reductase-like flavin-dependent oxidoreductase (luciferase family)